MDQTGKYSLQASESFEAWLGAQTCLLILGLSHGDLIPGHGARVHGSCSSVPEYESERYGENSEQ